MKGWSSLRLMGTLPLETLIVSMWNPPILTLHTNNMRNKGFPRTKKFQKTECFYMRHKRGSRRKSILSKYRETRIRCSLSYIGSPRFIFRQCRFLLRKHMGWFKSVGIRLLKSSVWFRSIMAKLNWKKCRYRKLERRRRYLRLTPNFLIISLTQEMIVTTYVKSINKRKS